MYKIFYSGEKNRIYIEITGLLSSLDEQNYINEMISLLDHIPENFTVCANLQNCHLSVIKKSSNFNIIRTYGEKKKVYKTAVILSTDVFDINSSSPINGLHNTFNDIVQAEQYLDL